MHPVSFVGAGPGARDLLTLRAADRLQSADVLIWTDSLVCPGILKLAPDECEKIRTSTMTLEEVVPLLVDRHKICLLYTSPSPRDRTRSRMPSSA